MKKPNVKIKQKFKFLKEKIKQFSQHINIRNCKVYKYI